MNDLNQILKQKGQKMAKPEKKAVKKAIQKELTSLKIIQKELEKEIKKDQTNIEINVSKLAETNNDIEELEGEIKDK